MKGGFSFCGIDIAELGIEYAPELKDTNVYRPAKANVHEETFEGHDGSYIYGASKEAKEFILRVFFEEKVIDRGLMEQIYNVFKVGRSGELVFSRRPWCYYYATVTDVDDTELRNYMNGLITITMKAAYPFARCKEIHNSVTDTVHSPLYCTRTDDNYDAIMLNTALFNRSDIVPITSFGSSGSPVVFDTIFPLANPGTEKAKVGIAIAGTASRGIIIKNLTTGQECKIIGMSAYETTTANKYLYIDGLSGKTSLMSSSSSEPAFLFHDHGFIELAPAYPCLREVFVAYEDYTVKPLNKLYGEYINHYIYLDSKWRKIIGQTSDTLTIESNGGALPQGKEQTTIMLMNEIKITPIGTPSITKLDFIYQPTFA